MLTLLALVTTVLLAALCVWLATGDQPLQSRRPRLAPPLPDAGHRAPVGLGPLSPSERYLRAEADRGIRELRLWMLDQGGAAA